MISLRKSVNELERLSELHQAAAECYAFTLRSVAQYAIEIDAGEAAEFRRHVEAMGEDWRAADSSSKMRSVQASLRGEMRDYQERASARLTRLRNDLDATAKALEGFAAGIAASGEEHQTRTDSELEHLNRVAESDSLVEMRRGVRMAAAEIASSLERMRCAHQMAIAQLKDEIRVLHEERQGERQSRAGGSESSCWTREKMEDKIAGLVRENQPFCLLFVSVRNLHWLETRYSPSILEGALKAMLQRIHGAAGANAILGRWALQTFTVILDAPPDGPIALTREITRKLAGGYSVQENGVSYEVKMDATVGTLDRGAEDEAAFSKKLAQVSRALEQT